MNDSIDEKILFVGIDCRNPKGGVASVEYEYSRQFSPFKFVRTCVSGGKLAKGLVAAEGIVKFIFKLLTDRKIRIVHVNAASDASFWRKRIFVNIAKCFGKRIVYHNHGGGFKRFYSEHPDAVRTTLAKADCVIALSETWRDFFADELRCIRVEIVNNPVTPPYAVNNPVTPPDDEQGCRSSYRSNAPVSHPSASPVKLLFLGAVMQPKGIYDLIEILSENRDEYSGKVELHIGGNGEVDRLCKLIKDERLGDLVKFEGWVDGEKKARLFGETDIYILPSYFEGLPISILEAMTYGKPVIATKVGGIPEIVKDGENGLLFDPGDKAALKASIDKLLENRDLRIAMGKNSLELVKPYYSSEVARSLRSLYASLIPNP